MLNYLKIIAILFLTCFSAYSFNGADTTGTGGGASTIRNITERQVANVAFSGARCLINKSSANPGEKIREIEAQESVIKQKMINKYKECSLDDKIFLFEYENCVLNACNKLPDNSSLDNIRDALAKACPHGEIMASKLSEKCKKSLFEL